MGNWKWEIRNQKWEIEYFTLTFYDVELNFLRLLSISTFYFLQRSPPESLKRDINANAAVTLLKQRPEKIQALNGIRTHDLTDSGRVLR